MSTTNIDPTLNSKAVSHVSEGEHEEEDNRMFGFIVFLLSESIIFFSFFVGYIVFKTTGSANWLPAGFEGLEVRDPLINTIVLVSSSFVIYFAERFLHRDNLWGFSDLLADDNGDGQLFFVRSGGGVERVALWLYVGCVRQRVLFADGLSRAACVHGRIVAGRDAGPLFYS